MQIQKVIHSSNDESMYLDFWPIVSKIWKIKFNVEPILLYFGNKKVDEQYGTVIKMDKLENIPDYSLCLFSRYWFPVTEKETVFMISDIDMLPISKWYFFDQISEISDDKYIHLNFNPSMPKYFPSCYHVAKGCMFEKVLNLNNSWSEFMHSGIWNYNSYSHKPIEINKNFDFWGSDESWASEKLLSYNQEDIVLFSRKKGLNSGRLDRSNWYWNEDMLKYLYDSHSIRPYSKYKHEIDKLVDKIL